jgi:hypothetical protein
MKLLFRQKAETPAHRFVANRPAGVRIMTGDAPGGT